VQAKPGAPISSSKTHQYKDLSLPLAAGKIAMACNTEIALLVLS
jgi:hypothetical protein